MNNIIVPSIFSDAVNEQLNTKLRAGRLAYNATNDVPDIRNAGGSVTFPQFKRVVSAVNVNKGTPLVPANIDMISCEAPIVQYGCSARVFDAENAAIQGRAMDSMIEQTATAIARALDIALTNACLEDAIYVSPCSEANAISIGDFELAIQNFGDDIDNNTFAGILCNSRLIPSLRAMNEFVGVNLTYNVANTVNGVVNDGVIGYLYGDIPVIISNSNSFDAEKGECITYMLKKDSLGYIIQKDILVEEEREAKLLATDIVASVLSASKLINPSGCVIIRKTVE